VVIDNQDDGPAFMVTATAAATKDETAFSESSFCQPGFRA
jgi:hypothetical protein